MRAEDAGPDKHLAKSGAADNQQTLVAEPCDVSDV